ncbi:MAG TPA: glycosyltransferase family 4 protein [Firmicutes bacterium]|nr:glycosyltransferase family 4 protein [Bacillota bacterium]
MAGFALDRKLKAAGYSSQIKVFGLEKGVKLPVGENLGRLSQRALADLYAKSDFGVVASLSNISLVPYEMMASYCPVVDFQFGSFSHFFPTDTTILTGGYPESFADSVLKYVEQPEERKALALRAKAAVHGHSWEETSRQFLELLRHPGQTAPGC